MASDFVNEFRSYAAAVVVMFLLATAACQDGGGSAKLGTSPAVVDTLSTQEICSRFLLRTTYAEPVSLTAKQRCDLVATAIRALSAADSTSGLLPADTGLVDSVFVLPIVIADSVGRQLENYWGVSLSLRGRSYDAEVQLDRDSSSRRLRRIHKPIPLRNVVPD